jgi:riboflavin kinase
MHLEITDLLIGLKKRTLKEIEVSTNSLAKSFGVSQQTISRKMRELVSLGLIEREVSPRGQKVWITNEGEKFLRKKYLELKTLVGKQIPKISFKGKVTSGAGESSYYLGLKDYSDQLKKKLGFVPYRGTLNLKLTSANDMKQKSELEQTKGIVIEGFRTKERTYGEAKCYPCIINSEVKGAVISPARSYYPPDVVQIISHVNLRRHFSLKEGDYVRIEVRE